MSIAETYHRLRAEIPRGVEIVLAAKSRTPEEVREGIAAGALNIGMNYVQEAAALKKELGEQAASVRWHMIGHLQTNKIPRALELFDVIQTVDSVKQAKLIARRAKAPVEVYIEVNISREPSKFGVYPEQADKLAREISGLKPLVLSGLMVMGPNVENISGYFAYAKQIFDCLRQSYPQIRHLSMGMSGNYAEAIAEGSTMVRLGNLVFGARFK
jgi:PLP dependent protein